MKNLLQKVAVAACLGILVFSLWRIYTFSVQNWARPWPVLALTVDGNSYLKGAERLAFGDETIFGMSDVSHSPGYQMFLGGMYRLTGSKEELIKWNKIWSLSCYGLSILLAAWLANMFFGRLTAAITVLIFACSRSWLYYCHMTQYEVLLGTLLLLWLATFVRTRTASAHKEISLAMVSAILVFFMVLIHGRFALLLLLPVCAYWQEKKRGETAWPELLVVGIPAALLLLWSLHYSQRLGHWIWITDGQALGFRLGNNPNSAGVAFPYSEIAEPSGWAFLFSRPLGFLWLVKERFLYIWGIRPDIWQLPPAQMGRSGWEERLAVFAMLLFFAGFCLSLSKQQIKRLWPLYFSLGAVLLPPLLVVGAQRFLVPVIPLVAMLQAFAVENFLIRIDVVRASVDRSIHSPNVSD